MIAEFLRVVLHHLPLAIADGEILVERDDQDAVWQSQFDLAQDLHSDMDIVMEEDDVRPLRLEELPEGAGHRRRILGAQPEPVADVLTPKVFPGAAQHDRAMGLRGQIAAREEDRLSESGARLEDPEEIVGRDLRSADAEVRDARAQ